MQYIGGKEKSGGNKISAIIKTISEKKNINSIVEPFCGGLSVTYRLCKSGLFVEASDKCLPLIELYKSVIDGWDPPKEVSFEEWIDWKNKNPIDSTDPMAAFCGFGCSRFGSWFSSFINYYKYTKRIVPAATAARTSLLRKINYCKNKVKFKHCDYKDININEGIIYCDPPYANTLEYPSVGDWNVDDFWNWAEFRVESGAIVLVSELKAPSDWSQIISLDIQSRITTNKERKRRIEHVFMHRKQKIYF